MCGKASLFRYAPLQCSGSAAVAQQAGGRAALVLFMLSGKAELFRTSSGKAAIPTPKQSNQSFLSVVADLRSISIFEVNDKLKFVGHSLET